MIAVPAPHAGAIEIATLIPALRVVTQTRPGQEQSLDRPRLIELVEEAMRIPALRLIFPQCHAPMTRMSMDVTGLVVLAFGRVGERDG